MASKDRITIFPSRANHVLMKSRIVSANKGLSLLKRKRDALELKMREIAALRATVSEHFEELFADSIFSIAKANFLDTDFKPAPIIGSDRADAFMRLNYTKTIGIQLPTFEPAIRKSESLPLTGLARGGKQVEVVREKFQELLRVIILLASYDYSIRILSDAIRTNSMRLNGLEFVVIPRLVNTSLYIRDELDELEREEFYRLKCSQAKQRKLKNRLKQDRHKEPAGPIYTDAATLTEFDEPDYITTMSPELSEAPSLSLLVWKKRKMTGGVQTLISGHYPGSQEVISAMDSIISGNVPTIVKRSSFDVYKQEAGQLNWEPTGDIFKPDMSAPSDPDTDMSSYKTAKTEEIDDDVPPSSSGVKSNKIFELDESDTGSSNKSSENDTAAQTDISGRYPKRSELNSPNLENTIDTLPEKAATPETATKLESSNKENQGEDDDDEDESEETEIKKE